MKPLLIILFLSLNSFSQSTGSVISDARSSLHNARAVYFTKLEKRGNSWFEVVEKLFIKKNVKLSKIFKKKLKNPGDIYFPFFLDGEKHKKIEILCI